VQNFCTTPNNWQFKPPKDGTFHFQEINFRFLLHHMNRFQQKSCLQKRRQNQESPP
jgi:hypothetical protein